MIRAGRVARRGADAGVLLGNAFVIGECFLPGVSPQIGAHTLVQAFGKGLGQPVCQRLEQNGRIVVVRGRKYLFLRVHTNPGGHGKGADVVGAHTLGRDEIGQAAAGAHHTVHHLLFGLLAQPMPGQHHVAP